MSSSAPSESEIYDRQIRLWGADAQSKMSSAKVLYVNITGISAEILKNLILAGIRAGIADGRPYPEAMAETPTSFLSPADDEKEDDDAEKGDRDSLQPETKRVKRMSVAKAMQPHVHELNPLLEECDINEDDLDSIPGDYFAKFDIVIASNISLDEAIRISKVVTSKGGKFMLVQSFGFHACAMLDLGPLHTFRKEIGKDKLSDVMNIKPYTSLEDMAKIKLADVKDRWHKNGPPLIYAKYRAILNYFAQKKAWPSQENEEDFVKVSKSFFKEQGLDENYLGGENDEELKCLSLTATAEVSPVCAVMGGVLGNEVLKAISSKGEPANNILLFDGMDGGCKSFVLK